MTHLNLMSEHDAELLSGGLDNPSAIYLGDRNWGQFKKDFPILALIIPNPSEVYLGNNYGQAK
ncbi:MAG: hypothetical protein ACO24U_10180 [Prochlorococcaceae cyanobacterium]